MRWETIQAHISAGLAVVCLAGCLGCGRASDELRGSRDRYLRRAQAARDAQDIERAIALCEQALSRRPDLAQAHLELALMLDHYHHDYVPALYHYQRYLQLWPDSEQRGDVEDMIQRGRVSFAAQIAESPAELKRDLQARDERIRKLETELAALRPPASVAPGPVRTPIVATGSAPLPAASAPARIHVVQAGENLGTISSRYYGTPAKWKNIFNANRDHVPDANNLRVGTRLDIPTEQ